MSCQKMMTRTIEAYSATHEEGSWFCLRKFHASVTLKIIGSDVRVVKLNMTCDMCSLRSAGAKQTGNRGLRCCAWA